MEKPISRNVISEDDKIVFRFFSDATPCWFEGCQELRQQYNTDLAEMQKHIAGFQRSDLIKEYVIKVKKALGMDTAVEEARRRHHITPDQITIEDGRKVIGGLSEAQQMPYRFFSDVSPCWFEGCEELRKAYRAEITQLEEQNPGCPECLKSPIMQDYLNKVISILEEQDNT